jgi:hypothetical protein
MNTGESWNCSLPLGPRPPRSLALQVFNWCKRYIRQPDGPDAGGPWCFTPEQMLFLWYFYAVDERGRWLWTRAVLRRAKGWGKSPFMAAVAIAEFLGPVRYWRDDRNGWPIGRPVPLPLVQIAGFSIAQTNNTMSMVLAMLDESPAVNDYGLDVGLTRIFADGGGKLEPITSSGSTTEGARPTFVVMDETHLWKPTDGLVKFAETIRRNLGKSRDGLARSCETTNAHEMGMESVAERSYLAFEAQRTGRARGATILYDSREAPPDTDLYDDDALEAALAGVYKDSTWVQVDRIIAEIRDPDTPPSEARRFYLNQLVVAEDAWIAPYQWDACRDDDRVLEEDTAITLFFDGSKSDDATGLVGCGIDDGHIWTFGVWRRPATMPAADEWNVPRAEVADIVDMVFKNYDVRAFWADPGSGKDDEGQRYWYPLIDRWSATYGAQLDLWASESGADRHAVMWDMSGTSKGLRQRLFTEACEATATDVADGNLTHDGNPVLREHATNAKRRPNAYGVSIGKDHPSSNYKIDLAVCAVGARMLRRLWLALPKNKRHRRKTGRMMTL